MVHNCSFSCIVKVFLLSMTPIVAVTVAFLCNSPTRSRIVMKTATVSPWLWHQFKTLLISRPKTTHEATKGQKQINQTALVFTATIWNEPYLTKLAYCKVQCWMLKQPPAQLSTKLTIRLKKQASIRFVIYIFQATDEVKNPIE